MEFERDDLAVLTGRVEVHYQDLELKADRVSVDLTAKTVTAEGNVILDQGPRRLSGTKLTFDLDTKSGTMTEAKAHVAPDYYFDGAEIAKVGDDTYTVVDGTFTSCEGESPSWSFHLARARVEVEGYAHVRGASMRVKKLPIFYTPYLLWPAKSERSSGLLVPNLGYSDRRGSYIGLAYYQVLGRSVDTTLYADLYGRDFLGFGDEVRYRPSEGTKGEFRGYTIRDPVAEDWRWKIELDHTTDDLPAGMRGVVTLKRYSDFDFFRDFERSFDRASVRYVESRGFVSGNWGPHLVNLQVTDRETFIDDSTTTDRRLPELEYTLRATQLGKTPLVLKVDSSVAYLSVDRSETYRSDYGRADLQPELSLPFRPAPWVSFSLSAGERFTWYGDSLDSTGQAFTGESLTRTVPVAGAEMIGPSFSRVYGKEGGARYKHVIEPRVTYSFQGDFEEFPAIPRFDQVDSLASGNVVRYSLINRLKAKPAPEPTAEATEGHSAGETAGETTDKAAGETGETAGEASEKAAGESSETSAEKPGEKSAGETADKGSGKTPGKPAGKGTGGAPASGGEIFSFELARSYSFDDAQPLERLATGETSQGGPIDATLRFNPSRDVDVRATASYSVLGGNLTQTSLASGLHFDRTQLDLRWNVRFAPDDGKTLSNQVRLATGVKVLPGRLALQVALDYDVEQKLLRDQRYFLDFNAKCYGIRLEVRQFDAVDRQTTDYRIAFTLKNVGTFLDLTGRSD